MTVLGSAESLVLLVATLIAFRVLPDLARTVAGVKDTGGLDHVLKLLLVLTVSAVIFCAKWFTTGSAQLTLFTVFFTVGAIVMIFRFLISVGIVASFKRFSADPVALLAQVVLGVGIGISSAMHGLSSPLGSGFMASNNTLFILLMFFIFLFRPTFAFHELLDAKYFRPVSKEEMISSCVSGHRVTGRLGGWKTILGRMLLAGISPVVLVILVFVNDPFFMAIIGLSMAVAGLTLARSLSDFWAMIESIRSAGAGDQQILKLSDIGLNYAILATPFIGLFVVCTASLTSLVFSEFVQESSVLDKYTFLPDRVLVRQSLALVVNMWLLVSCVQAVVTVAYKRAVANLKSYM
jgi:hypothetical protein